MHINIRAVGFHLQLFMWKYFFFPELLLCASSLMMESLGPVGTIRHYSLLRSRTAGSNPKGDGPVYHVSDHRAGVRFSAQR
jgi:hypothetical protein